MNEQRNMILFVVIFIAVLFGWQYFYEAPRVEQTAQSTKVEQTGDHPSDAIVNEEENQPKVAGKELAFESKTVVGSINTIGATLDKVILKDYKETTDPKSQDVQILASKNSQFPYQAEFGWIAADNVVKVPDTNTIWQSNGDNGLGSTLSWNSDQGLLFQQTYSIDDLYLFNVKSTVTNNGDKPVTLYPYGKIVRGQPSELRDFFILHEGPLGYINGKLEEYKYEKLREEKKVTLKGDGGWIGITDKYWLTALVPAQDSSYEFYFRNKSVGADESYVSGYYGKSVVVQPGQTVSISHNLFVGPKVLSMLDDYETKLNVPHFDLAVDFGWFYFITKPIFHIMNWLRDLLGNFGLAILLLTVVLKLFFLPLANKSYRSMAKMKKLQPKMEELKKKYSDDKMRMNQEVMELYKREKVNPAAGCLPILIQIPVFFALYKVLFVSIEMRHAQFYGWIHDLSAPDPTTIFNLFGLISWTPPSMLMIGAWPIIMGLSMFIQQKLNPAPQDPIQEKMFMLMPVFLTVMLSSFPAGLVIYWTWNNILSIAQQWFIMKISAEKTEAPKAKKARA